jgi:AmmeMemoRadiSam system radical SAM enzyme
MWKLDIEDVAVLESTEGRVLRQYTPEQMVNEALRSHCKSIASTYNEPTVSTEFSYQVFKLAKSKSLYTVYVTNGYESVETLNFLGPYLDAMNIDLKSFSEQFYSKVCGAHLEGVCVTIRRAVAMGIHTEVTTLVIPGENDSREELEQIAAFLVSVDPSIVWHVSAYHDDYHFSGRGRTPVSTLERAVQIGKAAGLKYIYMGNVRATDGIYTKCPKCGTLLVEREWGNARLRMKNGKCKCGEVVPGLFADASNLPKKLQCVPVELAETKAVIADASGFGENVVLFAGKRGTSKGIAEQIGERLGFVVVDLEGVKLESLFGLRRVVFVVATYGRGAPPPSATDFWNQLSVVGGRVARPDAEFAVFGCGSSKFAESYCGFAKNLEAKLISLGFKEVAPIGLRDCQEENPEVRFLEWISRVIFT